MENDKLRDKIGPMSSFVTGDSQAVFENLQRHLRSMLKGMR